MKWMSVTMSEPEVLKSHVLEARVDELKTKLQRACITEGEMRIFQKIAAIMEDGQGHIDGDDLIATSFVKDALSYRQTP